MQWSLRLVSKYHPDTWTHHISFACGATAAAVAAAAFPGRENERTYVVKFYNLHVMYVNV